MIISVLSINSFAQKKFMVGDDYSDDPVNPDSFNQELFQTVLLHSINQYLKNHNYEGFKSHGFLELAARQHAIIMARTENARLESDVRDYETVRKRLISAGGTGIGGELVHRVNALVDNEFITYQELVDQCMFRWTSSARDLEELTAQRYFFAGANAQFDDRQRRIYVSFYMGNYASLLTKIDESLINGLAMPPTTRSHGLIPYDEDICERAMRRLPNHLDLQSGLSVNEVGEIIFEHEDLRMMQRFLRERGDGLAVDIIQKSQFADCRVQNIADFSQVNLGVMTQWESANRIFRNNIAEGEGPRDRVTSLKVVLGHFPENLRIEDTELNLMLIVDRSVCANIPPSYVDNTIHDYVGGVRILPDTIIPAGVPAYSATAEKAEFRFKIPFEKGQDIFDINHIQPVIEALTEPSLNINEIFITAYSSIEGDATDNVNLQIRRANRISDAIKDYKKENVTQKISTETNWIDFKSDIKGTEHEYLLELSREEIHKKVNANADKFEEYLKRHRYADVKLIVNFNIHSGNEQSFVLREFNSAVESGKLNRALSIQKFILKQVTRGNYDSHAVSDMRIPHGKPYAGLNMNKIWLTQFIFMDPLNKHYCRQIDELYELDSDNHFIRYNKLACEIEFGDYSIDRTASYLQEQVNRMYNTRIGEKHVDRLNIDLQNKIIDQYKEEFDYTGPMIESSLTKLKDIINFDDISWQNSLKLAGIFTSIKDYQYALNLLEPWIEQPEISMDLIRSYIFLCTKIEYKIHSQRFYIALKRLKEHNNREFCDLFRSSGKLSVQTFVNTEVKKLYCDSCR